MSDKTPTPRYDDLSAATQGSLWSQAGPVWEAEFRKLERDLAAAREQIAAKDAEIARLNVGIRRESSARIAYEADIARRDREIADLLDRAEAAEARASLISDAYSTAMQRVKEVEARTREVEAERDALRKERDGVILDAETNCTAVGEALVMRDVLEAENAELRTDLREMAVAITAGERGSGLHAPRWIVESTIALARKYAAPNTDTPESYAPNGCGKEGE